MSMTARISSDLHAAVHAHSDTEYVEVVLELDHDAAPIDMAHAKTAFEVLARPVERAIAEAGGTVGGKAWINGTIQATMPLPAVDKMAEINGVSAIDLPRTINADVI